MKKIIVALSIISFALTPVLANPSGNAAADAALLKAAEARNSNPIAIKKALKNGANVNAKNEDGQTALKIAGKTYNTEIEDLLKDAGAKE
jgi:ankyrin repeat protein